MTPIQRARSALRSYPIGTKAKTKHLERLRLIAIRFPRLSSECKLGVLSLAEIGRTAKEMFDSGKILNEKQFAHDAAIALEKKIARRQHEQGQPKEI